MMRVVWVAAIATGALFAGNQISRAQYGGPYPPPYVPPNYTQRQVVPDLPPTVNLQPYGVSNNRPFEGANHDPGSCPPPTLLSSMSPGNTHTGYANERDIVTGWYVGGMVGAVYLEDQHSDAVNASFRREVDAAFDWNANVGGAFGYRMPVRPHDMGQLRFEIDTLINKNNVKTLLSNGSERANPLGEVVAYSFMFNAVMDFIHFSGPIRPYIGGGVGFMHVREQLQYGPARFIDSDEVFAFQGMAGVSVQLWERVQWFVEWRYLGGSNPKFTRIGPPAPPSRVELRSEYNSHSVLSGLRIDLQ